MCDTIDNDYMRGCNEVTPKTLSESDMLETKPGPSFLQTPSSLGLVRVTHQAPFLLHYLVMLVICLVTGESSNLFTGAIWPVLNFHFRKFKWMNKHKNEMVHELLNYHTIYYYVRCL